MDDQSFEYQPIEERTLTPWSTTTKAFVGAVLLVLIGLGLYFFRPVFVPLIVATIMAYIFYPLAHGLSTGARIPHGLATAIIYLVVVLLMIPFILELVPIVGEQAIFIQQTFIAFLSWIQESSADTIAIASFEMEIGALVNEVTTGLTDVARQAVPGTITFISDVARVVVFSVFTAVFGFYLTRDGKKIVRWIQDLAPPQYRSDAADLLAEINLIWRAFLRGQIILSLTVMVITGTIAAILGLPQPVLLGLWGGLLELLPSIGNMIWGATVIILAIVAGESATLPLMGLPFVLVVIGAYIAFSQIDINILIPTIIGRQVRLHPMVVIIGVIVGASVGGVLGVALAAPTIASLRVVGRYIYARLFDLEPFPMVGPPSAPVEERMEIAEEMEEQPTITAPSLQKITGRFRRPNLGDGEMMDESDATDMDMFE